jgi:hypothetical protein
LKYFSIQIDLCNESEICFYITLGMFFDWYFKNALSFKRNKIPM